MARSMLLGTNTLSPRPLDDSGPRERLLGQDVQGSYDPRSLLVSAAGMRVCVHGRSSMHAVMRARAPFGYAASQAAGCFWADQAARAGCAGLV